MPKDVVTLGLEGEITLADFDLRVGRFRRLVDALTAEVAPKVNINWVIAGLEKGSAITRARGVVAEDWEIPRVEAVVSAYLRVGRALEAHEQIPFSPRVARPAAALISGLRGTKIESVRFETQDDDALIVTETAGKVTALFPPVPATLGAVQGRIQTVSNRGSLHFMLYSSLDDKPVSCYLQEGQEDALRDLFGHLARVEGRVKRNPVSGRPVTIRDVRVTPLEEADRGGLRRAIGTLPTKKGEPLPEELVRRMRDA